MCSRFTRAYTWSDLHDFLNVRLPAHEDALPPSYNVAPTQPSAIVRMTTERRRDLAIARWGLVPPQADDPSIGTQLVNAHAERVANEPAFRAAYRRRRCLVPVSGFYEWQDIPSRDMKQPWYIRPAGGGIMCLAGLWERWEKASRAMESFTIITTDANRFVRRLHNRMPVILRPEVFDTWLDPQATPEALGALLVPAPVEAVEAHPVSTRINDVYANDPSLVVPV